MAIAVVGVATVTRFRRECLCPFFRIHSGWCDTCNVGYIAGLTIPSKMLFEALHNHGHDVDRRFVSCQSCLRALDSHGFCERCRIGYVDGQAYFSALAYQLARGQAKRPDQITCDLCRSNVQHGGWCDACKTGMLGNVAITDQAGFDAALPEFHRLQLGLAHLAKCEVCGVAIASNGMCPDCWLEYHDGKAVPVPRPAREAPDNE